MLWFLNCGEFFHPNCQPYKKEMNQVTNFGWIELMWKSSCQRIL